MCEMACGSLADVLGGAKQAGGQYELLWRLAGVPRCESRCLGQAAGALETVTGSPVREKQATGGSVAPAAPPTCKKCL